MAKASTKKSSGFVYKPRSADTVKGRANRKAGNFDSIFKQGFDTYTSAVGDNSIRYLPPTWDDSEHYGYTIFVHNNVGADSSTYLCPRKMLGKHCPICDAQKEAKDAGENDEADKLKVSERIVSWILNRDGDDPEKPVLYSQSWTQDRDVTALCVNERTGEILMIDHPDKGYDVFYKRTGQGLKTKYYGWQIDRQDSPIAESEKVQDEILEYIRDNPVPDTLNFYDEAYLSGVLSGAVAKKDQDIEDEDKDDPPFDGGRTRGPRRDNDPKDAEDEEDDPPKRTSSRGRAPVEEPEEDDPPPRSSRGRRAEPEEEEDDPPPRSRGRRQEPEDEPVDEEQDDAPPARATRGRSRPEPEEEEDEPAPSSRRSSRR